jgi:hypothetical protein
MAIATRPVESKEVAIYQGSEGTGDLASTTIASSHLRGAAPLAGTARKRRGIGEGSMGNRVGGKAAFITGAARGPGWSMRSGSPKLDEFGGEFGRHGGGVTEFYDDPHLFAPSDVGHSDHRGVADRGMLGGG